MTRWVTRVGCHVDRAACAWLILRHVDAGATFEFVETDEVPHDAIAFDMVGVPLSHHGDDCTFETMLRRYELVLALTGPMFDGLYEYRRRALLSGRDPA